MLLFVPINYFEEANMSTLDLSVLKPRSTAEILDQGIRLYRKNFLKFIGIIALVQIPLSILTTISTSYTYQNLTQLNSNPTPSDPFGVFTPDYFTSLGITYFLAFVSFVLISGVATAAMTRAVSDNYLGQETGIIDAYKRIGRSWVSLVGALILLTLISIPVFIWFIIPCVGWLTGPGLFVFLWGMVGSLIAPVVVLENLSAGKALRRAWDLAKRRFWWLLGFLFILYLFNQIVVTGPIMVLSFISAFADFQDAVVSGTTPIQSTLTLIIQSIIVMVVSLLYIPLRTTCVTLAYMDLRVRLEGLDISLLAKQPEYETRDIAEVTAQAPAAEKTSLLTLVDVGNFALVTLGIITLYIVLMIILAALGLGLASQLVP